MFDMLKAPYENLELLFIDNKFNFVTAFGEAPLVLFQGEKVLVSKVTLKECTTSTILQASANQGLVEKIMIVNHTAYGKI